MVAAGATTGARLRDPPPRGLGWAGDRPPTSGFTTSGLELPGINQHDHHISVLLAATDQRAARASVRRHIVPDWRSVAAHYDGIHLSWAGFITAEGCVVDLAGGDVTMLRYWFSERTLWLADVFTEPRLAPDPQVNLSSAANTTRGSRPALLWTATSSFASSDADRHRNAGSSAPVLGGE